ncbi:hypothetical protein [Streptomyces sp. NPDC001404]|uniref:hypothetical protein n=1 Tax=Streptomyces sp. NPDC001404 TaxID=3364571 RepID=UPI0036C56F79
MTADLSGHRWRGMDIRVQLHHNNHLIVTELPMALLWIVAMLEANVTNLRGDLEKALRHPISDALWDFLTDMRYTSEVDDDCQSVEYLVDIARRVLAAGRAAERTTAEGISDPPRNAAVSARIDALSAIYASWAHDDPDVRWFRYHALTPFGTPEFHAYLKKQGPYPDHRLLEESEVRLWVLARHNAAAPDGDGDRHIRDLLGQRQQGDSKSTINLGYIADRQELVLTVDARSHLGELARLAEKLVDRYRWRPSEATTFTLTGRVPEVFIYTGSASIRHNENAATTRVTMTLDPALNPEQVADIYGRLKARLQPQYQKSLSVKHYRLAQHVGPHVTTYVQNPSQVSRRGRPPRPGPTGLAQFTEPIGGHTWQSLRRDWNSRHGQQADNLGRSWRYDSAPNFIRDAKQALQRLLYPRYEWQK